MFGKHNNASLRPYALGISPQSSVYGSTIPVVYGTTRITPSLIWAANLRQSGGSNKTVKVKKNGPATYVENVDFLLGQNPITAVLQMWQNQGAKQGMSFASQAFSISPGGAGSVTITDPFFYYLLGVTLRVGHNTTFNDYGGGGPRHLIGATEYPLWNANNAGPDRLDVGGWRHYPWVYSWQPFAGTTVLIPVNAQGALPAGVLTCYYCKTNGPSSPQIPMSNLRLTFENALGNGPEYSGFGSQQIIYPDYAGMGSQNLDMGSTQMLPTILPEVVGAFGLYPRGDCDFVDMIEDIFKGVGQGVHGDGPAYSTLYHGLNCYDFPGAIQKKMVSTAAVVSTIPFDLPVNQPNTLVVAVKNASGASLVISDSEGNAWTGLGSSPLGYDVQDAGPGLVSTSADTVTISPADANTDAQLFEISGFDQLSGIPEITGTNGPIVGSITTTQLPGEPALILAVVIATDTPTGFQPSAPPTHWNNLMVGVGNIYSMYRVVYAPGTYEFRSNPFMLGGWSLTLKLFTNSQPVPWAKPIGNILDMDTLAMVRKQCRANGLQGSFVLDSQRKASAWLEDLYQAANAAPVWSGFKLKSIPWSEVSAIGNGAVYEAPTAAGPLVDLIDDDFITAEGEPTIVVERRGQVDTENILQLQHPSRDSDYNDVIMAQPEQGTISMFGGRKKDPQVLRCVQQVVVARMLLGIASRRKNYLRNLYHFTLQAKWKLLEPMDLVTITDVNIGLDHLPVRLIQIDESEIYELVCTAEPYQYGVMAPAAVEAGEPAPYQPDREAVPALVNAPVLFEPVKELAGFPTIDQLWMVVSNSDPNYGGCQVYISTDGGSSYNLVGSITGNGITGVTTANWPAAADPDFANPLDLDLAESLGELNSYDVADKDNFVYPCWVDGGAGSIPYELMTYDVANLTGPNRYTLDPASGLRRSVYGAPTAGVGVDHPIDSRFAFIGQGSIGMLKIDVQDTLIGVTLFFKFVAFNTFGSGNQNIADCIAYSFTPTGLTIAP